MSPPPVRLPSASNVKGAGQVAESAGSMRTVSGTGGVAVGSPVSVAPVTVHSESAVFSTLRTTVWARPVPS